MSEHGSRGPRSRALPLSLPAVLILSVAWPLTAFAQDIPAGYQRYHVIGQEQHVWDMFQHVRAQQVGGSFADHVRSTVSVTASSHNQVVIYDHWEDGFEADPDHPVQATTLVFGDLDPSNGDVRDFTTLAVIDGDFLTPGTHLTLSSDRASGDPLHRRVPVNPRSASHVRFDGGDLILSRGGPISVVHAQDPGVPWIGGSTEIIARQALEQATSYSIPVGVDTYTRLGGRFGHGAPFRYVFVNLVAHDDDTHVFVDNHDGDTASFTLQRGQHWTSRGLIDGQSGPSVEIREGTKISTDKPVAGLIFTGSNGRYQTRLYALLPDALHSTDFITAAPGDDPRANGNRPLNLYVYNPHARPLSVRATDALGTTILRVPPNGVRAYTEPTSSGGAGRTVPNDSTVRLTAAHRFWGVSAYEYDFHNVDWGHSWLATEFLTPFYTVPWSPGTQELADCCCDDPPCNSSNRSPVFVSAVRDNTRVQIDLDADGVYDRVDTDSDDVPDAAPLPNNTYLIDALETLRVYDHTDWDNSGTRIVASKPVAVAYGQDSDQGEDGDDTLDLGHLVYPLQQRWIDTVLTLDKSATANFVSSAGGRVDLTLIVRTHGHGPVSDLAVFDILPQATGGAAAMTYIPGTTVITYPDGSSATDDPAITDLDPTAGVQQRLDWPLAQDVMQADQTLTVTFGVNLPGAIPDEAYRSVGRADGTYSGVPGLLCPANDSCRVFSPQATLDVVKTDVVLTTVVDKAEAGQGDTLTYTVTVDNTGANAETNVIVSNGLPANVTPVIGSITTGGTYDPAQNAIVWSTEALAAGATASANFQVTIDAGTPGGTVIADASDYESTETLLFTSAEALTTVVGPELSLTLLGPAGAAPGQVVTIDAVLVNAAASGATNAYIDVPFPNNADYKPDSLSYSVDGGPFTTLTDADDGDAGALTQTGLTFALDALAGGATVVVRYQVRVVTARSPHTTSTPRRSAAAPRPPSRPPRCSRSPSTSTATATASPTPSSTALAAPTTPSTPTAMASTTTATPTPTTTASPTPSRAPATATATRPLTTSIATATATASKTSSRPAGPTPTATAPSTASATATATASTIRPSRRPYPTRTSTATATSTGSTSTATTTASPTPRRPPPTSTATASPTTATSTATPTPSPTPSRPAAPTATATASSTASATATATAGTTTPPPPPCPSRTPTAPRAPTTAIATATATACAMSTRSSSAPIPPTPTATATACPTPPSSPPATRPPTTPRTPTRWTPTATMMACPTASRSMAPGPSPPSARPIPTTPTATTT